MDSIAKATGVNIALLFYYFKSKNLLYKAALEEILAKWCTRVLATLQGPQSPKREVLAYINMYFYLAQSESPSSFRLVYQEIMRQGVSSSPPLTKLPQDFSKPIHLALRR